MMGGYQQPEKLMRKLAILALLLLTLAACNDDKKPDIVPVVVWSATPDPNTTGTGVIVVTATPDATSEAEVTTTVTATRTATTPQAVAPTQRPTTRAASPTPAPEIFPTNTVSEVQLAETVFEHGRMFWIRHSRQIWVMVASEDDPNSGDWFCYNDTFEEGEMETDPALTPPQDMLQPRRGFGKLWRSHQELKDGLGWAITPEFELTSPYTYIPGGYVQDNQYFPGPGEHRLNTLYNQTIAFYEGNIRGDCQGGTWRIASGQ
jgi:hypothetical protein